MEKLKQTIRTVASTASTVLIHGESGTGKELVARAVHICSPRATEPSFRSIAALSRKPCWKANCSATSKGAFTGANQNKRGLFEVADGGTIFLDEIGEMTLAMQVKLLRVLQERTVRPVGGTSEIAIDVRVIAATNRDLDKAVAEDTVSRGSLLPAQCDSDSRAPLANAAKIFRFWPIIFSRNTRTAAGRSILRVACPIARLTLRIRVARQRSPAGKHSRTRRRPGNDRRVARRVSRRASQGARVRLPPLEEAVPEIGGDVTLPEGVGMESYVAGIERSLLQSALNQSGGVQTKAADVLGISYRSFRHLMKKYGL